MKNGVKKAKNLTKHYVKGQGRVVIKMDIDLSTKEEVEFRFSQLCACFAILVRDKTEPQDVYLELFYVVNALKEKYC